MKLGYVLLASLCLLSSFAFAQSKPTKMVNVSVACENKNEFMAFNLTDKRIWVGQPPYVKGADGIEVTQVAIEESRVGKILNYTGKLDFIQPGGVGIKGALFMNKLPMENTVEVEGAPTKFHMFCKNQ